MRPYNWSNPSVRILHFDPCIGAVNFITSLGLWRYILVEAEQIPRVVLSLDLHEPCEGGRRVRITHAIRAFPFQEVDLPARAFVADGLPK